LVVLLTGVFAAESSPNMFACGTAGEGTKFPLASTVSPPVGAPAVVPGKRPPNELSCGGAIGICGI